MTALISLGLRSVIVTVRGVAAVAPARKVHTIRFVEGETDSLGFHVGSIRPREQTLFRNRNTPLREGCMPSEKILIAVYIEATDRPAPPGRWASDSGVLNRKPVEDVPGVEEIEDPGIARNSRS